MVGEIPSHTSLPCQPGNIFDPIEEKCSPGNTCTALCVPPDCHLTCTEEVDLISDPNDCGTYRVCLAGVVVGEPQHCNSDTPYFNGKFCGTDANQCCSELCTPYCYKNVIQAPDPEDCKAFYICLEEGEPSQDNHFYCPNDEIFDISLGRCTPDAQCRILCDDSTSGPTVTTSTTPDGIITSTPGGCKDSLTCIDAGFFAQCTTCQPGYFQCQGVGQQGILHSCPDGKVFNTNENAPFCISPEICPFFP
uniref:Chitin-binding type-2 domain-containing protein n=1 Tax=Scylla olivacea TaxID=85551 RepID=A0A0P4W2G1_SCYOL